MLHHQQSKGLNMDDLKKDPEIDIQTLDQMTTNLLDTLNMESNFARVRNISQAQVTIHKYSESQELKFKEVINNLLQRLKSLEKSCQNKTVISQEHEKRMSILKKECQEIQFSIDQIDKDIKNYAHNSALIESELEELERKEIQLKRDIEDYQKSTEFSVQLYEHIAPLIFDLENDNVVALICGTEETKTFDLSGMNREEVVEYMWEQLEINRL